MKRIGFFAAISVLAAFVFQSGQTWGQDFYVQSSLGNDSNSGSTWGAGNALATIQAAVNLAQVTAGSDAIYVAAGTYSENIDVAGDVSIYGGYPSDGGGVRSPAANPTIIDGGVSGSALAILNVDNVLIDGFVIRNGSVIGRGGGLDIEDCSSITISNNIIEDNTATDDWGGGIAVVSSSVTITENILQNNSTNWSGGGISFYDRCSGDVIANTITGNSAVNGAGMIVEGSDLAVSGNVIKNNTADYEGGAVYLDYVTSLTLANNIISGNTAERGGGIYCDLSSPTIINCTITGNTAIGTSGFAGGGIFSANNASPIIANCIFWADSPDEISVEETGSILAVTYSDIQGGYSGQGNIDSDPLFVDSSNGDYHIALGSPCIDTGTYSGAPVTDIEGNTRPYGNAIDMGAYENLGLWSGAIDLGAGWKYLEWFGYFWVYGSPSWIWHVEHGWVFSSGTTTTSISFWTPDMGWFWSSDAYYPWIYIINSAAWEVWD
ncbi:MAG: right-handed parallel beta-helix repeat-containing protein [Thermodesulfobacteriota bacterium]|nr:right-handed parallel beta-helix repeat-containing protein [Thermodesulfobacteriota bacterium]